MNWALAFARSSRVLSRWVLAFGLIFVGCTEECVDQFDCRKVQSKSPLTCEDGRCVVKTTLPMLPTFTQPDAGRPDGGTPVATDGGRPELVPGAFTARLSGGQLIPPHATTATGTLTAALELTDAGPMFSWALSVTNTVPAALALGFGAQAGRIPTSTLPLTGDAGVVALTRAQAEQIAAMRASIIATPDLRGQIVPRGAFVGFTQLTSSDGGYGGGGQIVFLTDGGFIPTAGLYDFDWSEAGPVQFAAALQGSAPLLILSRTGGLGATGTFSPLSLLTGLTDAGIVVYGFGADGGTVFRGDLSLSLR